MSVRSRLKPAMLAAIVVAAGSVLAPAPVQAQEVTVLRGSPPRPLPPSFVYDNSQDSQPSNYSPSSYDDAYPYYGDGFPVGGDGRGFHRGFRRGDLFHRGFRGGLHAGFRRGGFHSGGFHSGGFHSGGFHGGGFSGGGFHGGGGHR